MKYRAYRITYNNTCCAKRKLYIYPCVFRSIWISSPLRLSQKWQCSKSWIKISHFQFIYKPLKLLNTSWRNHYWYINCWVESWSKLIKRCGNDNVDIEMVLYHNQEKYRSLWNGDPKTHNNLYLHILRHLLISDYSLRSPGIKGISITYSLPIISLVAKPNILKLVIVARVLWEALHFYLPNGILLVRI